MKTAWVDFDQLLSGLRDIYKTANIPDEDGTQLQVISDICKDLLESAGWEVPERLETDHFPFFEEDRDEFEEEETE